MQHPRIHFPYDCLSLSHDDLNSTTTSSRRQGVYVSSSGLVNRMIELRIGQAPQKSRIRFSAGLLQIILSKLSTYCLLRPTQPPILSGTMTGHF